MKGYSKVKDLAVLEGYVKQLAELKGDTLSEMDIRKFNQVNFRVKYVIELAVEMGLDSTAEFLEDFQDVLSAIMQRKFSNAFARAGEIYAKLKTTKASSMDTVGVYVVVHPRKSNGPSLRVKVSQNLKGEIVDILLGVEEGFTATPSQPGEQ